MNTKRIVGAIVAVIVAGTVGVLANLLTTNDGSTAETKPGTSTSEPATPTPSPAATPTASLPEDLVLSAGAAGPVKAGMDKAAAVATGLLIANEQVPVEGCPVPPLSWKASFAKTFDVQTLGNGEVASIGVHRPGPTTASGLGVGSTYAEVLAAVEDGTAAVEAGYGQSGVREYDPNTGGWIGYLFDAALDDLDASDQVTFIEITKGGEPGLMRDGC